MSRQEDAAWSALDDLVVALRESLEMTAEALARAEAACDLRGSGQRWSDMAAVAKRPVLVEMLSQNLERQSEAGSRFRRALARVLHSEGMSMDAIADLFGVSRQRVSTLIRNRG